MIANPWFLMAVGAVVVIFGHFMSALTRPPRPMQIDLDMSDEEIAANLQSQGGGSWASLVLFAGYLLFVISLAWRFVLLLGSLL